MAGTCTIISFLMCSIHTAFRKSANGGAIGSTQILPFCHEITPTFIDPCTSNPCVTGECTNLRDGQFKCNCTDGWHGSLCNTGFTCGNADSTCLPFSAVCNLTVECPNYFDESNCCGDAAIGFNCKVPPYCVSSNEICNGEKDCLNMYDEFHYCRHPCTITATPIVSTATSAVLLTSTKLSKISCITTPISATIVPLSPRKPTPTSQTISGTTNTTPTTISASETTYGKTTFQLSKAHTTNSGRFEISFDPIISKETSTYMLTSTKLSITISSTILSQSPKETTTQTTPESDNAFVLTPATMQATETDDTTYGMIAYQQSIAPPERSGKSFFADTKNIAGLATGIVIVVFGKVAFILAAKLYKTKRRH